MSEFREISRELSPLEIEGQGFDLLGQLGTRLSIAKKLRKKGKPDMDKLFKIVDSRISSGGENTSRDMRFELGDFEYVISRRETAASLEIEVAKFSMPNSDSKIISEGMRVRIGKPGANVSNLIEYHRQKKGKDGGAFTLTSKNTPEAIDKNRKFIGSII